MPLFNNTAGDNAFVWIGQGSTKGEKQQSMMLTSRYLKSMGRFDSTCVTRVVEGQEDRSRSFLAVFE